MQEMGLLLQKENEPKQEKNQQAPGLPCADSVGGGDCRLLWTLPLGGVSSPSGGAPAGEGLWTPSQRFMGRK